MSKDRIDWSEIINKCQKDWASLTGKEDMPARKFIRAWMQTHYNIIKLSGYFYRKFEHPKQIGLNEKLI